MLNSNLFSELWLISAAGMEQVRRAAMTIDAKPESFFLMFENEKDVKPYEVEDGVATITAHGVLYAKEQSWHRWASVSSYEAISKAIKAADADSDVISTKLDVDSPGGLAKGCAECADVIRNSVKPVTGVSGGTACSAGYYLLSACQNIEISKDAILGSIGTMMTFYDFTKMDADLGIKEIRFTSKQSPKKNPKPDSKEGRDEYQSVVDTLGGLFVADVARYRNTTDKDVMKNFGQGGLLIGQDAVDAGMADTLKTPNHKSTGQSGQSNGVSTMSIETAAELLAQYPALCAELQATARTEGTEAAQAETTQAVEQATTAERARVTALIELGGNAKPEQMKTAIESGTDAGAFAIELIKSGTGAPSLNSQREDGTDANFVANSDGNDGDSTDARAKSIGSGMRR